MTHVAHPYIQRIGVIRDWKSRWFAGDKKKFREYLRTDAAIRKLLEKRLKGMSVDTVEIDRNEKELRITIRTSRPGIVIGRSGEGAANLKKDIDMLLRTLKLTEKPEIKIDIEEIRSPETRLHSLGANRVLWCNQPASVEDRLKSTRERRPLRYALTYERLDCFNNKSYSIARTLLIAK